MCKQQGETANHLFNDCTFFSELLTLVLRRFSITESEFQKFHNLTMQQLMIDTRVEFKIREVILILCFVLWRERCSRIFREEFKPAHLLVKEVTSP
jgi:hypothetical protein